MHLMARQGLLATEGSSRAATWRLQRVMEGPATKFRKWLRRRAAFAGRPFVFQPVMLRRGLCSGNAVLRGEKAPDDALARELDAMGLL